MNQLTLFLMLAIFIGAAESTEHSTCFNYFMQKDGCVFSSADQKTRCQAPPKALPVVKAVRHPLFPSNLLASRSHKDQNHNTSLFRRSDATKPVFPIGGGNGICRPYNSTTEIGVCLWSGAEQTNPTVNTAGWINGLKTSNCDKRIYIQRTGKPNTVQYAKVLDGCSFDTVKLDDGCFQIGVTVALFNKFKPSAEEQARQLLLGGVTWDL